MHQFFSRREFDLIIVGGGIIGATLASLLASQSPSLNIALVDGGDEPAFDDSSFDPRVIALSKASEAVFVDVGVWQSILAARTCAYREMFVWDGEGTGDIHFDSADIYQQNLGHIIENSAITTCLHHKLTSQVNIERVFKVRVSHVQEQDTQQILSLDNGQDISASLVIAADGAKSFLRDLAGFKVREWDYGHSAIVTTVTTEKDHTFTAWQRFSQEGPLAFLPLSLDGQEQKHCSIVWSLEHDLAKDRMQDDDDDFCRALSETFEYKLGKVINTDQRHCFPLTQRHSTSYIRQGLALVGDAAHTIHPLAGQGANLGIYDVKVLAEEIERAVQRCVPLQHLSILKRYERRRQAHNLMAMSSMEAFKRVFAADNLAVRWLRNTGLKQVNNLPWLKNTFSRIASGQM